MTDPIMNTDEYRMAFTRHRFNERVKENGNGKSLPLQEFSKLWHKTQEELNAANH